MPTFKTLTRDDAEVWLQSCKNIQGSTLLVGSVVAIDTDDENNGYAVVLPNTSGGSELEHAAGVIIGTTIGGDDIVDDAFGLMQIYGYNATVKIDGSGGDTVLLGEPLEAAAAAAFTGGAYGTTTERLKGFSMNTTTISTDTTGAAWLTFV